MPAQIEITWVITGTKKSIPETNARTDAGRVTVAGMDGCMAATVPDPPRASMDPGAKGGVALPESVDPAGWGVDCAPPEKGRIVAPQLGHLMVRSLAAATTCLHSGHVDGGVSMV